jgi:hypothetical protein
MWLALPLVFITGILNRIADMTADDDLRMNRCLGYSIGILYGFLIAHVITQYTILAPLGIAIIISVLATGKIDHPVHYLGMASFVLFLLLLGIPSMDIFLFVIFILGAAADEIGNNMADRGKISGFAGLFFGWRLTMEVVTFLVSLFTGIWIFFMAMLSYDTGFAYIFPERVRRFLINKSKSKD